MYGRFARDTRKEPINQDTRSLNHKTLTASKYLKSNNFSERKRRVRASLSLSQKFKILAPTNENEFPHKFPHDTITTVLAICN
jgi:hypothetical protein